MVMNPVREPSTARTWINIAVLLCCCAAVLPEDAVQNGLFCVRHHQWPVLKKPSCEPSASPRRDAKRAFRRPAFLLGPRYHAIFSLPAASSLVTACLSFATTRSLETALSSLDYNSR